MNLQQLQSAVCHTNDGEAFRKYTAPVSFLPAPNPPTFGLLGSTAEKDWGFQSIEGKGTIEIEEENEIYFGNEKNDVRVGHHGVEVEGQSISVGRESKLCARGHWRPAEDAKLKELVSQYGPQNWNLIAEKLEGRSGKSCRLRWFNQLDPRINRRPFSEEEEERLLAAHRLYGNKWAMIARIFPGRTDNGVKNHWHVIMARKQREQSSSYRKRKPPSHAHQHQRVEMRSNNACSGESTITSTRDDSASTCPDLSLSPSSSRIVYGGSARFSPPQHQHSFESLMGSDEKMVSLRNGYYEKFNESGNGFYHGGSLVIMGGADQSGYSDSNSEVSATESVANIRNRPHMYGDSDHGREKITLSFIDFLGVGAT